MARKCHFMFWPLFDFSVSLCLAVIISVSSLLFLSIYSFGFDEFGSFPFHCPIRECRLWKILWREKMERLLSLCFWSIIYKHFYLGVCEMLEIMRSVSVCCPEEGITMAFLSLTQLVTELVSHFFLCVRVCVRERFNTHWFQMKPL